MGFATTQEREQTEHADSPQPIRGDAGASILGPRNVPVERENPDLLASPYTDAGTIPNLKFSYAAARNRLTTGGWAREVTVRELPVATELAGVNMRLKPGGIREMHWHKEAEWAFMLAGRARITAIDPQGRNFIDDVEVGDLWNFPAGVPHSIQGLEEGCEFLLVFDSGNFSENETFLISDWFAHTPREVLGARATGGKRGSLARGDHARDIQLRLTGRQPHQGVGGPSPHRGFIQFPGCDHHCRSAGGG
jgi:oxalate decarboxylase